MDSLGFITVTTEQADKIIGASLIYWTKEHKCVLLI